MTGLIESLNISSSPYINAAISVLAFVVVAKIADLFVDRVLRRFSSFTKTEIDDIIIDLIHYPIFLTIILIGLINAVLYLNPPQKIIYYSNGLLYTVITLIWTITIIRISRLIVKHTINKVSDVTGLGRDIIPLVENIAKIAIMIASLTVILSYWKINITPVIASAGIAGAAVALAAKDTIANFIGGVSVFIDKPFKIGDYIVLDGGERGEVVAIGLRSTRIKTRDDILIAIPNAIVANTRIINESAPVPRFRVRIPVSVAYGSDIDLVEKTLLDISLENKNVLDSPAPRVRFREFGDSSLRFELLCWAREPAVRGLTIHEINSSIYWKFRETGIKIPFPQRDVHIYREGSSGN
ncbi:Potassium efflux system KefA protein / Small-conductance mechanosensitive channel [hydrothermal vent metagenome]|uniref:Potassium efflux system KefA protein / Small-conductance mechanosensitive channel n=1 Tax=hydrothermal vent metagenome TaxID=652676 RepID=A0A3B1E009_9ZZZZ